jgi:hypothetical protein
VRVIAIEGRSSLWKREVRRDFKKFEVYTFMRPLTSRRKSPSIPLLPRGKLPEFEIDTITCIGN